MSNLGDQEGAIQPCGLLRQTELRLCLERLSGFEVDGRNEGQHLAMGGRAAQQHTQ